MKIIIFCMFSAILVMGFLSSAFDVKAVEFVETVYIRGDGSVDPLTAPIQRDGDVYTLTGNISIYAAGIVIERDNMTLDGGGYTLQASGAYSSEGILLDGRKNVTIKNMQIKTFPYGIYLKSSSNNSIVGNNITNNRYGIYLDSSSNNSISGNLIDDGLFVFDSYGNVVVDNLVNGKPLVYLEGMSHVNVVEAGQVILVNCEDIRVENLNLSYTSVGVELLQTESTVISGNSITNNREGIRLYFSSNNSISGNNIKTNSIGGIGLDSSYNNRISGNNITNNRSGIDLDDSSNNSIAENNITENSNWGIMFDNSSNNSISGNNVANNGHYESTPSPWITIWYGIEIHSSSGNSISGNNITANIIGGIGLYSCSNISISGNNITENIGGGIGINLSSSSNSSIIGNVITNNADGIYLDSSDNNNISGNSITENNWDGINLISSSNNTLRDNHFSDNKRGSLYVSGMELSHFINDVDSSNTVNGKPVYYWVNRKDEVVPADAGYVVVVNSTGITVKNLELKNSESILFAYTTNSTITGNNITNNCYCVVLRFSSNIMVSNNMMRGVERLQGLWTSGIELDYSENNTIVGNTLEDYLIGIYCFHPSNYNFVYYNNFVNNALQVFGYWGLTGIWDYGYPAGGNYWSDYNGTDSNHDGIGDTPYIIDANNADRYPLMGTFLSFNTSSGYAVDISTNSSITDFEYSESNQTITAYVSNMTSDQTYGFCRICIPHTLVNASEISVIIDDGLTPVLYPNYTLYDDGTRTWIYFAYEHSTHKIDVLPEFPTFTILPILMATTLLANILYRKNRRTKRT
ncbi:MAG TPA: NosD domain-containing protein [Candidatus Bathyarchaeia archaeon]